MFDLILELLGYVAILLPGVRRKRRRREEWSGTVEAKKTPALSAHAFLVIFQTDDGLRKKVRVDRKEEFDAYQEGRRYTKKTGEDSPH